MYHKVISFALIGIGWLLIFLALADLFERPTDVDPQVISGVLVLGLGSVLNVLVDIRDRQVP